MPGGGGVVAWVWDMAICRGWRARSRRGAGGGAWRGARGEGGRVLVRPVGVARWLPARVEWEDGGADAALVVVEEEAWRAPTGESVLRWGEPAGSEPVPCAAVGFPWASVRGRIGCGDTAHL